MRRYRSFRSSQTPPPSGVAAAAYNNVTLPPGPIETNATLPSSVVSAGAYEEVGTPPEAGQYADTDHAKPGDLEQLR